MAAFLSKVPSAEPFGGANMEDEEQVERGLFSPSFRVRSTISRCSCRRRTASGRARRHNSSRNSHAPRTRDRIKESATPLTSLHDDLNMERPINIPTPARRLSTTHGAQSFSRGIRQHGEPRTGSDRHLDMDVDGSLREFFGISDRGPCINGSLASQKKDRRIPKTTTRRSGRRGAPDFYDIATSP